MPITIDPEFANLCPALSDAEKAQLEDNLKAEGCRDALVVWGDVLLDGHNRHAICTRLGIDYRTVEAAGVETRGEAVNWIIANQLGRRNLSPTEASYLRGKRYNAEKLTLAERSKESHRNRGNPAGDNSPPAQTSKTATKLGGEFGIGPKAVIQDGQFAAAIDSIAANVGEDAAREIRSGQAGLTKQAVREVAKLPPEMQAEALQKAKEQKTMRKTQTPPVRRIKETRNLRVVHDSDRQVAEQVSSLLHRLNEVSAKIEPEALYRKFPDDLRHNLDQALSGAAFFVGDLHRLWVSNQTKAAG